VLSRVMTSPAEIYSREQLLILSVFFARA
jgi:hypothetical protein